ITGCINTESYTLADDSELPIVTLSKVDNTICDSGIGFNGSVTASVTYKGSGVTLPDANYVFIWHDGASTTDPVIAVGDNTDEVLAGLEGGFYTVTVNNVTLGCTSDPVTIEVVDDQYFPDISITITPQTYCVGLSGELLATIDETSIGGGNPADPNDYSFTWYEYDNATNTSTALGVGVVGGVNGEAVTQLPEGYYRLEVVRTSTGCINNEIVFLPENITIPDVTLTKVSDLTTCGSPNGALQADVGGVEAGYTFHWYNDGDAVDENFVIANADVVNVDNGSYTGLIPGDYTVVAVNNTTGCISPMQTERVLNATNAISINVNFDILPTDCNIGNGQMTATPTVALTVTDPDTDFTYEWFEGGPTNTDPVDFFTNPPTFGAAAFASTRTIGGLTSGTFTVVVTYNATGCSELRTIFLPFIDSPEITATVENSTECPYTSGNGEVTIDIDASGITALPPAGDPSGAIDNDNFTLNLYSGANADVLIAGPTDLDPPTYPANGPVTVATGLAPGFYTIELIEDYTGNNCSVFEVVEVAIDALPPIVSLVGTVSSNTACDLNQADGEFTVDVAKDPDDNAVGTTYTLDISPDPTSSYPIVGQPVGAYSFTQLPPDTYTVTVTASTGCSTTRNFTVPDAPTVSEIVDGDVIITAADLCTPSGSIEITNINLIGVGPDNLDDFEFTWYDDAGLTNIVFQAQGDATATNGGEVLDNVNYAGMGPGTYWVVAQKTTGVGAGCFSAPFQSIVPDVSVDPEISLQAFSNTSCTDLAPEGSITIDVTTASGPGAGGTYTYNITGPAGYNNVLNAQSGVGNTVTGLDDGTYTIVATNETTGCSVTGVITVPVNETPIIITAAIATDQELCTPDGRAEVTGVSIDGGVTNRPLNEFEFTWFKDDPNGTPLVDGGAVTITDPFVDITNYPSIEAGTYYVVATRLTGFSPGAGCSSPPARVDIFDVHVNPQISLEPFANTSCNTDFEGSITIDASTPSGPGVGATYTYDITGPNGYAATLNAQTGAANNVPDLEDGTYTVIATNEVTGCTVTGTVTIPKNQTPIIITAAAGIDQELCSPDGRAEVTGVSIDGGVSTRPLGEFEFRWFKDDPNSTALVDGGAVTITDSFIDITNYPSIEAGTYYVVAIRLPGNVPGAGCVSPPARVEILDSHVNPNISLQAFANTSCNTDFEGSITINASTPSGPGVGATYTYDITGPNGYANTLNAQTGVSNNVPNLEDGTYTVIATNEVTSCIVTGTVTILKNETPIIITAAAGIDQELCSPDGRAEVTGVSIDGGATNQPLSEFEFRWFKDDPNSTALVDGGAVTITDPFIDITNYPTIEAGTYYVVAIRLPGNVPGAGCESPPARVDILDSHVNPQIALQGFANTSCTSDYEGSIIIDMTTPSGPGVGATYTYDITGPDGYANLLNAQTGNANSITSLKEGTYTIIATNEITSCEVTGSITLLTSQTPIIVTSAVAIDQQLCTPDGRIDVTGVSIDGGTTTRPLNEFEFTWYKDDPASAPLVDGASAEIKDTFLDISNYPSIEAGVYYVVATRLPGFTPGAGCSSPPARVEIIDSHVNPQVTLSATSNTACDGNFDGTLTINVSDPSGPGVGATYAYDVTHDGSPFTNSTGNSGVGNTLTDLEEGIYVVIATNETTGCSSTATKTIEHKPQPVDVVTVDHEDQDICYPDGRIEVTVTSPTAPANYTYEWYFDDISSGALTDQFGTIISGAVLEAGTLAGQYPAMGAGTYYVIATRNATNAPGSGCSSPPFRVDVLDISTDPIPTVSFTPNTACDPALANGTVTASVQEQDGSTGDTYTFVWSYEGGALPGTVVQNDVGNTSNLTNASEGKYELLITNVSNTGCSITTSVNVTLDQPQSQPNIIDVATFDPVDCMPTGWAEVQSISIGGGAAITDPVVLSNDFTYRWYEGDVLPANQLTDTDPRIDNLLPGQYFVVVTSNITGCESIPKEVNILDEDRILPVIAIEQTVPQINCIGPPFSAELRATAEESDGNVGTYVFTWSYEGGALPPGANVSATTPTSSTLSNLPSGTYEVTALNPTTGCSSSAFFIVKDESERYKPVVSTSSEPLTFCTGDNGSILLANVRFPDDYPFNINNYTVDWYNGDAPDLSAAPDYPNTDRVSNLPDGVYTIRVTDNNTGCFVVKLQNIKDERQYPVIEITESSQTTCPPYLPNGVLTATVGGRVGGYSFEWFSGSTAGAQGTGLTTRNRLIGYPAGVYTVRVIDKLTGCSEEETWELKDVHLIPPSPTPELLSNVTSCIEPDGKVTVTVQGETQGYDFLWYEGASVSGSPFSDRINVVGLDIGTYTVTATDATTGCVSDGVPIDVGDDRLLPEFGFETVGSKCDENTGQATIAITNNTVVSTVQWFEVSTGASVGLGTDLNGVGPGEYEALVTTLLGCENTGVVEIGTVITNYNLVSADGDGINDVFQIDCITNFPNNNVRIYNRAGVLVYEIDEYNNADRAFRGVGEQGLYSMGDKLPNGTYFYLIDKGDGSEIISGFLELIR
ncbi:gliding motility-associated C-terminal domain-containing protein, partial [Fulvivirga kasyanovii]|nr:gliding motility-associated C-terminal domain-containing protein [Fulvivirga kasyanovii]